MSVAIVVRRWVGEGGGVVCRQFIFKKLFNFVLLRLFTKFRCLTMPGTCQQVCGGGWWVVVVGGGGSFENIFSFIFGPVFFIFNLLRTIFRGNQFQKFPTSFKKRPKFSFTFDQVQSFIIF